MAMKPMKPMTPMQPMTWAKPWWPDALGEPSSVGGQNGVRYAFFPRTRRLLVQQGGTTTTYDSGDLEIGGVSQQDSGDGGSLTFTSQNGPVDLETLAKVG